MIRVEKKDKIAKLKEYADLINEFLSNKIDALEFERRYLKTFKNDETLWIDKEFEILNGLFADVDAFCHDPKLRGPNDLDEAQLRQRTELALNEIEKLLQKMEEEVN